MSKSLEKAGNPDSPEENMRIIEQLLSDVSKLEVSGGKQQITQSILEGPNGSMIMESRWILQKDGSWYLTTIVLKYIN